LLRWDLQYGPSVDKLRALQEAGNEVPALDRRDNMEIGFADWIWDGYVELMKGRVWNGGQPQPIALPDVLAYSDLVGLSREDASSLLKFVRMLDEVYFDFLKGKAAPKKDGGIRSNNRRTRRGKRR
jgi:hypothetical protein